MENTQIMGPLFNIEMIKKNAIHSMSDGAVTSDYSLNVKQACQLLNEALASEIICMLRYRHHQISAKGIDYPEITAEFKEHAENEEKHLLMLAERINQLGGEANFNPANLLERATTEFGSAKDIVSMVREDLIAERIAVEVYRKLVQWFGVNDPTTRRMLESILEDEEDHAEEMADILKKWTLSDEKPVGDEITDYFLSE